MAPRLQIRRHPERALAVPEDAQAILAQGIVAHVGFEQEGWPYVMPMTFLYREGSIFLHGAPGSRIIKTLGAGARCCITVTLLDGLIASKSAETHSVNYRSVVCFGRGRSVTDERTRVAVLEEMIGRYFPGRAAGADYAHITRQELKATRLVEVPLEAISAKGRDGGPRGPFDADPDAPGSAGVFAPVIGGGPLDANDGPSLP
jgi:nitroimidazol reductase NimA-like FMN-containing flavoprotein (pyridoxamine 5'-phosphate oxidase superfamily)